MGSLHPAELQCTAEEMKDYFLRFAYPGQNPANPVIDRHSYTVGYPYTNFPMQFGWGAIQVRISEDGFTSVNTTKPGHILYDGKIIRHLSQGADGAWQVTTTGYGNNTTVNVITPGSPPGLNPPNEIPVSLSSVNTWQGVGIFNDLDHQMIAYIEDHH